MTDQTHYRTTEISEAETETTPHPVIALSDVTKRFSGTYALNQVNFDVRPGEIHALLGENGAGKSTLVKVISGAQPQDSGSLIVDGSNGALPPRVTRQKPVWRWFTRRVRSSSR